MSRHACRMLGLFVLAVTAFVQGCQSTSPITSVVARHGGTVTTPPTSPPAGPVVLAPGMEVEWHVKSGKDGTAVRSGISIVAADGKIEMGPYGTCRVGGLTIAKAQTALERHLAKQVPHAVVTISSPTAGPPPTKTADVSWRPADTGTTVSASWLQVPKDGGPDLGGEVKDKEKEQIAGPLPQLPMPQELAGPKHGPIGSPLLSAPNECRPTLLPPYVIGPTDVLLIQSLEGLKTQAVSGPHLVGPDGAVRLGIYGSVQVAGQTLDQARTTIAEAIHNRLDKDVIKLDTVLKGISIDVLAYNSKVYYIIVDGARQQGDQIVALPVTGNDKVLDAFAKIGGLPVVSSKYRIWVARQSCGNGPETILPVDWCGISKRGDGTTNWQLMPNDRIFVAPDPWYVADGTLAKVLRPAERLLGITLLGSQTVNSIKSGSVGGSGTR
jgi:protein involved in polysaccharide export with SLBB domain